MQGRFDEEDKRSSGLGLYLVKEIAEAYGEESRLDGLNWAVHKWMCVSRKRKVRICRKDSWKMLFY
ncbi:MAG: hypothetical protein ACOC38_13250 [Promethearchaeia archaeon]